MDLFFSFSSNPREMVNWLRGQMMNLSERLFQFVEIFPENAEVYVPEDSEGLAVGNASARLVVNPVLKDTWYENPVKDNDVTNVPEQSDWLAHKSYFPSISQSGNPLNVLPKDLSVCNVRIFLLPQSPEFIFHEHLERFLKGPILVKGLSKSGATKFSQESNGKIDLDGGLWSLCSEVSIKIDRRIVDCEKLLRLRLEKGVELTKC